MLEQDVLREEPIILQGPIISRLLDIARDRRMQTPDILSKAMNLFSFVALSSLKGVDFYYGFALEPRAVIYYGLNFPFFDHLIPAFSIEDNSARLNIHMPVTRKNEEDFRKMRRKYFHLANYPDLLADACRLYYANYLMNQQGYDLFYDDNTTLQENAFLLLDTSRL